MKNIEIRTIEHKGVKVTMKVDYDKGEASLVTLTYDSHGYINKQWIFANRGLGYMSGWLNIWMLQKRKVRFCVKRRSLLRQLQEKVQFDRKAKRAAEMHPVRNANA